MYEKFIVYYNDEDDLAKVRSAFEAHGYQTLTAIRGEHADNLRLWYNSGGKRVLLIHKDLIKSASEQGLIGYYSYQADALISLTQNQDKPIIEAYTGMGKI